MISRWLCRTEAVWERNPNIKSVAFCVKSVIGSAAVICEFSLAAHTCDAEWAIPQPYADSVVTMAVENPLR